MLSNALNFLSDKRRRFHRSDTMPVFKSVTCPENTATKDSVSRPNDVADEQGALRQQTERHPHELHGADPIQEKISQDFQPVGHTSKPNASDSVTTYGRPFRTTPDQESFAVSYMTTPKTTTVTNNNTIKRSPIDNLVQSEYDLTRTSGEARCYRGGELISQSKLETLSLPLQSHIPLHSLNVDLGESHSLSPSPLSFGSSVSPNMQKDEDMRTAYNAKSFELKGIEKDLKTAQKLNLLSDEHCEFVRTFETPKMTSGEWIDDQQATDFKINTSDSQKMNENKEFASYVNSARNRVAQIRAKAGGKSKLHRSNSSAQVIRRSREQVSGIGDRVRATSTQREFTIPLNSTAEVEITHREQSVDRKRRGRRRGKTWIERGPRSRSVTSSFHKEKSPCSSESGKSKMELLAELAKRATAEQCCKICVTTFGDFEQSGSQPSDSSSGLLPKTQTASALTDFSPSAHSQPLSSQMTLTQSKRNRYTVVRRLRRNNSSINWPADRPFPHVENDLNVPTSQTAGDLLLPSKDALLANTRLAHEQETQQLLINLCSWIDRNDIEKITEHHQKLVELKDELSSPEAFVRSEVSLTPLDYAILTACPQVIALLIMLGLQPGPMLNVVLERGPSTRSLTDPMKFFLSRRIRDVETTVSTAQVSLDTAISRANAYSLAQKNPNLIDLDPSVISEAFSEVAQKEADLARAIKRRNKLVELRNALERYPPIAAAPSKVVLMVFSTQSLLVRVSPPKFLQSTSGNDNPSNPIESINEGDTTSCESSSTENSNVTCEGRRLAGCQPDQFSSLVIRYRIEWSYTADFQQKVFACSVIPPIRFSSINNCLNNPNPYARSFIRTGFYELDGLQPGQPVYVRVYAFTVRGWSEPCYSKPRCGSPSSWIDVLPSRKEKAPGSSVPLRYGAQAFTEKFQSLKKLLDQQLLLWAYRQPSTRNTGDGSAGNDDGAGGAGGAGGGGGGGKRTKSPMIQRKRSFRFPFASKGIKFVKQTKSGVYLALVCHSTPIGTLTNSDREVLDKCQLILCDDFIPMVCVTREEPNPGAQLSADINWFARLLAQPKFGTDLQLISDNLLRSTTPTNLQFRLSLLTALQRMQLAIGSYDVGVLYPDLFKGYSPDCGTPNLISDLSDPLHSTHTSTAGKLNEDAMNNASTGVPITPISTASQDPLQSSAQSAIIMVLVKHVHNMTDVTFSGGLRWYPLYKFLRQNKLNPADFTSVGQEHVPTCRILSTESESNSQRNISARMDQLYRTPEMHLLSNLDGLLHYSERRAIKLTPGLYVGLIQMHAQFDHQAKILAAKTSDVIHMLPVERIRRRAHVCRSEWSTLYNLLVSTDPDSAPVSNARLVLNEPLELRFCRKLHEAWLRLAKRLQYTDEELMEFRYYLPEVIQISPQHALILIFPKTDQVCLPPGKPQTLPPNTCSWIIMTYFERNLGLTYDPVFYSTASSLMSILELLIPMSTLMQRQCINDSELSQCTERTNTLQSIYQQVDSSFQEKRWLSEVISSARDRKNRHSLTLSARSLKAFVDSVIRHVKTGKYELRILGDLGGISLGRAQWNDVIYLGSPEGLNEAIQLVERRTNTHEVRNLLGVCHVTSDNVPHELPRELQPTASHDRQVSVIRVHAGYTTGFTPGTSVKVLVSVRATARDIVNVVVSKLNRTLEVKRRSHSCKPRSAFLPLPNFEAIDSAQFCLTVSLGTIERCIPDTIRPLLLRKPWRSGKLYVRLIHDLPQYISSNSPTRLYLAFENEVSAIPKENIGYMTVLLSPVQSQRPRIHIVNSVLHWAIRSNPPTVFLDGAPIRRE